MQFKNPFVTEATRAFLDEARKVQDYSFFDFLHGYIYARWPYLYIGVGTGEHPLTKWLAPLAGWFNKLATNGKPRDSNGSKITFADTYHGKAVPLETAKQLVQINEEIRIPDLEQVIPYKRARSIIMNNPDHIVVLDCPCRSARENPCLPLDVCLIIGDPFASFIQEHHSERSRYITSDEAVDILKAEDERGHVHHAFFKDAMLERFYAICNCCDCCCGAMQAHRNGTPMLASSGYVSYIDEDLCIGCGDCEDYCQFHALEVVDGVNRVIYENCMGCGVCVNHCTQNAVSLVQDESKGIPLDVCSLMKEAILVE
ncbi:MAG TPA: 4Fe-4S binding protein [Anaerolineales bacterium]|jgi:Pyruvate/2-oxoacid:ferredoxin oxidoreductase delta subunit|nr:4Fe-4S binding protein [Anaerolineales bacterium]